MQIFLLAILAVVAVVIYRDARALGVRRSAHRGLTDMSPAAWAVGTLLLAIVFIPAYLVTRPRLIREHQGAFSEAALAATARPSMARGRKITIATIVIVAYVLLSVLYVHQSVHKYGHSGEMVAWLPILFAAAVLLIALKVGNDRKTRDRTARLHRGQISAVVLGASGLDVGSGQSVTVDFYSDSAIAISPSRGHTIRIPHERIASIHVDGPGTVTSTGGFIGGGFGIAGAAEGVLAATVLNSASTKTSTITRVHITSSLGALSIQTSEAGILTMQQVLANLESYLRHRAASEAPLSTPALSPRKRETPPTIGASRVDQLDRLAQLHVAGHLTADEFAAEKQRLLAPSAPEPAKAYRGRHRATAS